MLIPNPLTSVAVEEVAFNLGLILLLLGVLSTVLSLRRVGDGKLNAVTIPLRSAIFVTVGLALLGLGLVL